MDVLITEEQIARRVNELGDDISCFYEGKPLTVVILMNGALLFGADLVRAIKQPLRWDSFICSSYHNDSSSGELVIRCDLKNPVKERHVLIVDDVLDTGLTLKAVKANLERRGALSVRTCVLLNKNVSGKYFIQPDWTGFDIPDQYVVGYGLDSNEEFRNLPYIAVKE